MIKVGISGKIASGKSEVECIIKNSGYQVFDLDIISREVFNKKDVQELILAEFATFNRSEIAQIIFENNSKKEALEKIIHPKLKEEIFNLFEKYKNEKAIFISGALLFKSGFYKFFDKMIFVNAPDEMRLERLMKRNNLSCENAKKRLNLQDDGAMADYVIQNDGDLIDLQNEVEKIFVQIGLCS